MPFMSHAAFDLVMNEIPDVTDEEITAVLTELMQNHLVPDDVKTVEAMRHYEIRPERLVSDPELGLIARNLQFVYRDTADGGLEAQFTPKGGAPEPFHPLVAIAGGRLFLFEEPVDYGIPEHRMLPVVVRYR